MSIRHEAILNFLLSHPHVKMGEVADYFGVSAPWLSLIVHSDAFQKLLRERQDIHFHVSMLPAMDKVQAIADLSLDRLMETIPFESDVGKLNQVAVKALDRLGYGIVSTPPAPPSHMTIQVKIERERLERARSLIGTSRQNGTVLDGETGESIDPEADPVGQADSETTFSITVRQNGAPAAGDDL